MTDRIRHYFAWRTTRGAMRYRLVLLIGKRRLYIPWPRPRHD